MNKKALEALKSLGKYVAFETKYGKEVVLIEDLGEYDIVEEALTPYTAKELEELLSVLIEGNNLFVSPVKYDKLSKSFSAESVDNGVYNVILTAIAWIDDEGNFRQSVWLPLHVVSKLVNFFDEEEDND